jgi:hypothetical protein
MSHQKRVKCRKQSGNRSLHFDVQIRTFPNRNYEKATENMKLSFFEQTKNIVTGLSND